MQKLIAFSLLLCVVLIKAEADGALPPGALKHGTLANTQLINDAKVGVAGKVGQMGCTRRWQELWIVAGCNKKYPVTIEFSEEGKDTNWTIR